jgi:hypothetical protein
MKTNGNDLKWNIYSHGVVGDLTISVWGSWSKLNPEELGMDEIPEQIYLGHKNLMNRDWFSRINTAVSKASGYLYRNTFAFPFGNARFIPYTMVSDVVEKMNQCKEEFNAAVWEFIANFEGRKQEMLVKFREIFQEILMTNVHPLNVGLKDFVIDDLVRKLEKKYPTTSELRRKFNFDFVVFEISTPEFKRIDGSEAIDKAQMNMEVVGLYKQQVAVKIDSFLEDVCASLKSMILKTTEHMKERLHAGSLTQTTIKSFVRFADEFRKKDFVGLDFEKELEEFKSKIQSAEKSDLSNEEFKTKLQGDLDEMQKKVTSMDIDLVLGKFRRRIERPAEVA